MPRAAALIPLHTELIMELHNNLLASKFSSTGDDDLVNPSKRDLLTTYVRASASIVGESALIRQYGALDEEQTNWNNKQGVHSNLTS